MLNVGLVLQPFGRYIVKLHFLKKIRIWYPLRTIRVPAWPEVVPEYQIPILGSVFCALLFYNFVESPWYMNLVVLWGVACLSLVGVCIASSYIAGKKHAK